MLIYTDRDNPLVKGLLAVLLTMILFAVPTALAHTTTVVGPYEIEVGWGLEPPVVGVRNTIVLSVTEPSPDNPNVQSGIFNAFRDMDVTVYHGGASKDLAIHSEVRPGNYFADIIPTKTGSYEVEIQGTLNGVPVDIRVSAEDVESSALLDFPPTAGTSNRDIDALKAQVEFMQNQIDSTTSAPAESSNGGMAYDISIMGISLGGAAVILAVVALARRSRT